MAKLSTVGYFPSTITIDGAELKVRIKRMSNAEWDAFREKYDTLGRPRGSGEESEADAKAREASALVWVREALAYLTIEKGEFEHDGREVTNGVDLIDIFAGRLDVVPQAIAVIYGEHVIAAPKKKTFMSLLASQLGYATVPPTTTTGNAPAPTATSAEPSSSAPDADATANVDALSCGTTAP